MWWLQNLDLKFAKLKIRGPMHVRHSGRTCQLPWRILADYNRVSLSNENRLAKKKILCKNGSVSQSKTSILLEQPPELGGCLKMWDWAFSEIPVPSSGKTQSQFISDMWLWSVWAYFGEGQDPPIRFWDLKSFIIILDNSWCMHLPVQDQEIPGPVSMLDWKSQSRLLVKQIPVPLPLIKTGLEFISPRPGNSSPVSMNGKGTGILPVQDQ